jgi:protoporphyrinogen oxidase
MIPYNTKFWTISPQELTCEWLDGFIPVPSLSQILEGTVEESKRQFGYNARFWYPKKGGIAQVPLSLAENISNIHTDCKVTEINLVKKEIKIASGEQEKFDYLISTLPLPEISSLIQQIPSDVNSAFKKLRWNSIFNLNLGMEIKNDSNKHWIYFPQKELCFFRVGFPHNFSSSLTPQGAGSLYTEVSYSKEKPINKNNIVSSIKKDLEKIGVLSIGDRILVEDINDIEYGYPIYDKNYAPARRKIINFLLKHGIIACGRYGSWRYMTVEDTLWDGKEAASLIEKSGFHKKEPFSIGVT